MKWRALFDARVRSEVLTRWRYGRQHFQGETTTLPDRFPVLFRACAELLAGVERPRILSFGCSTGEEVFSLAKYLPGAEMVGFDINAWCIREAVRKNESAQIEFFVRFSDRFDALNALDAIFCMAVFQRAEHRDGVVERIEGGFTFELFERELFGLDRKLRVGGLLFLDHCDFAFGDTLLAARYEVVRFAGSERVRDRPLFGRDNRLVAAGYSAERCFRKLVAM